MYEKETPIRNEDNGLETEGYGICQVMSTKGNRVYCTRECVFMGTNTCNLEALKKLLSDLCL